MKRDHCDTSGMALVLALAAVLIISTLLAGSLLLDVSYLSLTGANSSHANALNLAEAGVNWELWKISRDPALADITPATIELPPGSGRSFQVHTEAYPGGGPWVPPQPLRVIATGTVDRVSRTVRVVARSYGISGPYALFGINVLHLGGNATINGASGTNGWVNVAGNPTLNGNFVYSGNAAGDTVTVTPPGQVLRAPLPEAYPTVNELANRRAWDRHSVGTSLGVDFFATSESGVPYNDNSSIVDATGAPIAIYDYRLDKQVFLQASADPNPYLADGITPNPLYNKRVIVLGPGDYYFESLDVQGNNGIRTEPGEGAVNIWLGPAEGSASGATDTIDGGSMFFSGQDSSRFHLYHGSQRTLRLTGTMDFYGTVYAYNGPDQSGQYYGTVQILGDGAIWGTVLGYDVDKTIGNATINFPSSGSAGPGAPSTAPGEPTLFFGFDREWQEVNPL